eukprot:TRINITY_DN8461_c0_g1_i1.p8 TRINITY_DN8461_c0_g1~~TRINITY_DN8461_c0_g1_i1.p8  ORF type:complete len:129 (-),score=0.28 TRINITY_DN8461_c0_g1_i1:2056-2442(-)
MPEQKCVLAIKKILLQFENLSALGTFYLKKFVEATNILKSLHIYLQKEEIYSFVLLHLQLFCTQYSLISWLYFYEAATKLPITINRELLSIITVNSLFSLRKERFFFVAITLVILLYTIFPDILALFL